MTSHRAEILAECEQELHKSGSDAALTGYASDFYDETLRAIRRDCGIPDSSSPLPASSETAARFGSTRQRAGVPITQVPRIFAAISQAVGKTGERYDLTISAEEYKLFNGCLDVGLATSIENFWRQDKDRENKLITEHFGFVAHELRNALGNANLAFKLLRSSGVDMNGRTADVLARNLVKMESLVAQSLASVRLEVGVAPVLVHVHVATLLRAVEASAITDRGIRIEVGAADSLWVSADETLLSSAVSNLLHNAIKFSRPDTLVRLTARALKDSILIEVEDECGGLRGDAADLFKPYVKQSEGNRTGTGLGLSITQRAVEAMSGTLSVANLLGHGCRFSLQFALLKR